MAPISAVNKMHITYILYFVDTKNLSLAAVAWYKASVDAAPDAESIFTPHGH
jgi:hypothetical protein